MYEEWLGRKYFYCDWLEKKFYYIVFFWGGKMILVCMKYVVLILCCEKGFNIKMFYVLIYVVWVIEKSIEIYMFIFFLWIDVKWVFKFFLDIIFWIKYYNV